MQLPEELNRMLDGQAFRPDEIGMSESTVLLFKDRVLKIQPVTPESRAEYTMMNWLRGRISVPECLYHTEQDGLSYLLMTRLGGEMACEETWLNDPEKLVKALAACLKQLWQVDVSECPVNWNLEHKLAFLETLVEQGKVDVEDAEPGTFGEGGFAGPQELLEWLKTNRPQEDFVLSHGDFCLPNVFFGENGEASLIDLGKTGISDRWQDIALCYRSLKHNYTEYADGEKLGFRPEQLFEELGIEPDWEKINYFILLDELF